MIDTTIPPICLYDEGDRDNNRTTSEYLGYWEKRFWHIHVSGKLPRDPAKTPAWASVDYLPHGLYHVEKGIFGEDPTICFKRAMLYALWQHRPLNGDPQICHDRWQNEVQPAIAQLEKELTGKVMHLIGDCVAVVQYTPEGHPWYTPGIVTAIAPTKEHYKVDIPERSHGWHHESELSPT